MQQNTLFAILLLAPFVGFLINGFRWKDKNCVLAGSIASGAAIISFVCAIILAIKLVSLPVDQRSITAEFFEWIVVGSFQANAHFLFDQISMIMTLIITGVGSLIHIFSMGYMDHDDRPAKFFAYLNFFLFNMLLLVLGDNLLVMFVGWEGVGLCSYLLIGFWFTDAEKAAAGMKAFITNRIGDAGFLIGIFMVFMAFGTVDYAGINEATGGLVAESSWMGPISLACLALFIGATGKSAQIPLYVWLPDAMAGPTPVSALIHAATMVTAGVYMIVRLNSMFVLAPSVMMLIAVIGALTALIAASIGMTQWDIKKVLAYSTVSQLGYMFLAVGVGAFMPALFHLMTHAFFKALMFLGSGSVIHAMHHEQDMRKMGGLKKYMPITHATFFCGWLAIIGAPFFSGFFSKDEILWYAFSSPMGHPLLWLVGAVAAAMTAFYMTRLMCLTFWGESRVDKSVHPHESPFTMTFPLIVLAVLSVIGGYIGIPHVIGDAFGHLPNVLEHWLNPVLFDLPKGKYGAAHEIALMGISVSLAGLSAIYAFNLYVRNPGSAEKNVQKMRSVYELVYNKYWVDEVYFQKIINPLIDMSKGLWLFIDVNFIDKTTYVVSDIVKGTGSTLKSVQNGNMQQYALYITLGLLAVVTYILVG